MTTTKFSDNALVTLIPATTPLVLSTSWQDVGLVMVSGDFDLAAFWLDIDINNSTDMQFKLLGSGSEAFTSAYELPIQDVSATKVGIQPQVFEISVDADQKVIIPVSISDGIPYIKLQAKVLVAGVTPGRVLSAFASAKTTGRAS